MPYFVFNKFPNRSVELIEHFDSFKDAKIFARDKRAAQTDQNNYEVKVVFANNSNEAEATLTTYRERPVTMEHEK